MFDVSINAFRLEDETNLIQLHNPLGLSMQRFRDKLLWNVLPNHPYLGSHYVPIIKSEFVPVKVKYGNLLDPHEIYSLYFLTLTVDNENYEKVFKSYGKRQVVEEQQDYPEREIIKQKYYKTVETGGSYTISKFLQKMRAYFTRDRVDRFGDSFEYAWRIERGTQSTQRYHFHVLLYTTANQDNLRGYIFSRWQYSNWVVLPQSQLDETIKKSDGSINSVIYACKYTSKKAKKGFKSAVWLKHELKCRLYGTTQQFTEKPACVFPKVELFDKLTQSKVPKGVKIPQEQKDFVWNFITPEHYRQGKNGIYQQYLQITPLYFRSIPKCKNNTEAIEEVMMNLEPLLSPTEINLTRFNDWKERFAENQEKPKLMVNLGERTEIKRGFQKDIAEISKYFSYKEKLERYCSLMPYYKNYGVHKDNTVIYRKNEKMKQFQFRFRNRKDDLRKYYERCEKANKNRKASMSRFLNKS